MLELKDPKQGYKTKRVCCGNCYHSDKDSRTKDWKCFHPYWGPQEIVNPTKDGCEWGYERIKYNG